MIRLALVAMLLNLFARAQTLPDAESLLKRVEARLEQISSDSALSFHYTRTNVLDEISSSGDVKKRVVKTYLVLLRQGLPRARLVAMDGRALPESEQRWRSSEEQRLQRALAQEKTPDYSRPKPWINDDLTARFNFKVEARTNYQGRGLIVMTFQPRPGARGESMVDRMINKISGALWIDEEEAEVALLNIKMNEPMKFWGGLLGQLDRFDFTMNRRRSPQGVWFNELSAGYIQIRKLFATARYRIREESYGFRPGEPSAPANSLLK